MVETFFTEKRIIKKIIIAIIFIFMFNFTFSYLGNNVVFAVEPSGSAPTQEVKKEYEIKEGGGKLLLPIHALIIFIADAVLQLMQNSFYSAESIIQKAKSEDMKDADEAAAIICVLAIVVCTLAVIYTAGTALSVPSVIAAAGAKATAAGSSAIAAKIIAAGSVAKTIARWSSYGRCSWCGCI